MAVAERALPVIIRGTAEGANCEGCPFSREGGPNRPVYSEGPEDPKWIIIGEGPGFNEVRLQRPFIGATGEVVMKLLTRVGRSRDDVMLNNATLCQPTQGSSDDDRHKAAQHCKTRLQLELQQHPGKPILLLGAVAARSVIPQAALDAIDPPDVPESKQKRQKRRQKADNDAQKKHEKRIEKAFNRIYKELLNYRKKQIFAEVVRRYKRKPDRAYLEREVDKDRQRLEIRAKEDAAKEIAQREIDKAKKPRKKKPIKISDIVGTCFDVDVDGSGPRAVIPAIHPAALLRGGGKSIAGSHTPDLAYVNLTYDFGKVDALAHGKNVRLKLTIATEGTDPKRATWLFVDELRTAIDEGKLALDLETYVDDPDRHHALMAYMARIRAIGIATKHRSISVLWDLLQPWALSYFQAILASNIAKVITHNGLYDRTVLRANGFEVCDDNYEDTLYAHHSAFPGCSHGLQTVTTQFYATSPWKCLRGDTDVLLPDRSTIPIERAVKERIERVLSLDEGEIRSKRVIGWHEASAPGQEWVSVKTERCDRKYTKGLIITPDHRVMTQRGLVEARELDPAIDRIAVDEPLFSEDQVSAAIGTLLGDSSLFVSRVFHRTPWEATRASLRGGHANQGLRDCKVSALALGTECKRVPANNRLSNGTLIRAADFFHYGTKWAFQYMQIAPLVYDQEWKRRIKPEALTRLGRRGLAMMFMDDGDLRIAGRATPVAGFATNGFLDDDVELFAQWIRDRYGAVSIYRSRGPYCSLSTKATLAMLEDLRGFIHPSVEYKTIFKDPFKPVIRGTGAYCARVLSVDSVPRDSVPKRLADKRYCLTVEGTKLFYTNYGLVSNSEFRNAEEDTEKLLTYNANDTGATYAIAPSIEILVRKNQNEKTYAIDRKMAECASRMHLRGMPVSREVNSELLKTFTDNVKESREEVESVARDPALREQIWHYLAFEQAKTKRKADLEDFQARYDARLAKIGEEDARGKWRWKISGGKHVAALVQALGVQLTQVTASGNVSTKKDVLESLVHIPAIRNLLTYRENDKLLSTFVWQIFDRFIDGNLVQTGFADSEDRIHPIWNVHKISGRWASYEPVVSNVPKSKYKKQLDGTMKQVRPNLRRQIQAPPGRKFVIFDFAQLEARNLALISGDEFLLDVFATGKDVHTECARVIFSGASGTTPFDRLDVIEGGVPCEICGHTDFHKLGAKCAKMKKQLRDLTKNVEYGAFYGGSPETLWKVLLKEGFNVKLSDVTTAVNTLMRKMSGIVRWQRNTVAKASLPPYTIKDFILGRRRTFPMGQVDPNEALNFESQSTAAAIMDIGMARMDDRVRDRGYKECFPIVQVHDSAAYECWAEDAEDVVADIEDCYEQEYSRDGLTIRYPVECKICDGWDGL